MTTEQRIKNLEFARLHERRPKRRKMLDRQIHRLKYPPAYQPTGQRKLSPRAAAALIGALVIGASTSVKE